MAGVKKSIAQVQRQHFYKGELYVPCKVVVNKLYSAGNKTYLSATNKQTGDVLCENGRPVPFNNIQWD